MTTKRNSKYRAKETTGSIPLLPKNDKQAAYMEALKSSPQVIVTGSAGTGKTYIAASWAARLFAAGKVERIILTRPNVPSGRSLGFFPGTMEEKMAPWVIPFTDVIEQHLGPGAFETSTKKRSIDIVPFEVMRGRTFHNAFVILDEAQNTTPSEMKMFLTRLGFNSKMVVTGDLTQTDLPSGMGSGLTQAKKVLATIHGVAFITLQAADVVRHRIVSQ